MMQIKAKVKERLLEIFAKIKKIFIERKQQIKGLASALGMVLLVSVITFVILLLTNVVGFQPEGGLGFNVEVFEAYTGSVLGTLGIVFVLSVLGILLCFIPGLSAASIALVMTIYPNEFDAFLVSFARVVMTSALLYLLGRLGGYNLCKKLLGEEDTEKALTLLRDNGTIYFPLMMMFPIFPDDALTMVAGTIKMKMAWFIPSIIVGRGVGVFTIVYGISRFLPNPDSAHYAYDWFVLATIIAFALYCVFYLATKLNKNMALQRAGKYKPFSFKNVKPEEKFGAGVAAVSLVITGLLVVLTAPEIFDVAPSKLWDTMMSIGIAKWFEILVMTVFWAVMCFFAGRSLYQLYRHIATYGKPIFAMRKLTLLRFIPVAATVVIALIATLIASFFDFFPKMEHFYDLMILITAYIIWPTAIYALSSKITSKIKKLIDKSHTAKEVFMAAEEKPAPTEEAKAADEQ